MLVDVERWSRRDELALALEGPVWDRYGQLAGCLSEDRARAAVGL